MNEIDIRHKIEALLFAASRPLSRVELAKKLGVSGEEVSKALSQQEEGRGIVFVDDGKEVELRTSPQVAVLIEEMRREELSRDIGKAGLEALAAILYRGPLSRSEIDFIRGVNSHRHSVRF